MGLGDIYRSLGRYEESEMMFKKALAINPASESYLGLGYLYLLQNRDTKAEDAFTTYLRVIRPKSEVYNGLGYLYLRRGRYAEAESAFQKSADINPTLGGYRGISETYMAQHDYAKAKEAIEKQLEYTPDDQSARAMLQELARS